jgi:ABC-type transport system involved in cytochrome c biogenesis permease component
MRMSDRQPIGPVSRTWLVVFKKELRDLWIGGKALNLTIAYTVLLGAYSYWMATDSLQSFTPPKEMVFELMKVAMIVAVFMGLIIGADTLSGERERNTFEGLLLTPTSRVQIVVGKFLAAVSTWPAAVVITTPYQYVLAQGDEVFGQSLMWGAILCSLLVPAFTALGMFVSFWCNSNKSSMFVTIGIYLIFLLPTQLPGHAQGGFMGLLFQALNPLAGTRHFLAGMLVNNRTPAEYSEFIVSAVVFFVATFVALFGYAAPALRLEGGKDKSVRMAGGGAAGIAIIAGLLVALSASPAAALQAEQAPAAAAPAAQAAAPVVQAPLQISIDKADTVVRAGLPLLFTTVVSNSGAEPTQPVIVAMNIINLNAKGEVVDPEDWSPQRTQYVQPLAPGQSATLSWRVNAILDGDFMVYMVAIPSPGGPEATSQPVASSGIHLTVTPYTKLNPGGVLPYAIGGPLLLGLVISIVYRRRRRQIDLGG